MLAAASAGSRGVGGGVLVGCYQRTTCPAAAYHCSSPAHQMPDPAQHNTKKADTDNYGFTGVCSYLSKLIYSCKCLDLNGYELHCSRRELSSGKLCFL